MSSQSLFRILSTLGMTIGVAVAQQAGQTSPPAGGGASTGGGAVTAPSRPGSTGTTNPNTIPGQQNSPFPTDMPRPIFLSGKVMLSDGVPPPEPVVIERVCGARVIPEGYTDSKGRFSFEVGHNSSMFMDASMDNVGGGRMGRNDPMGSSRTGSSTMGSSGNSGERSMMGCELRANLAGFRSDMVNLSSRRSMDNPEVGTIVLHRLANVEGLTISGTSLNAPKDAKKAYDKGRELAKKGKLDDASKQFDKAVELYPKYAVAWYERGRIYEEQNKLDDAKKAYGESLAADSKLMLPYERLAGMAMQTRNWQETADITDRMIRLNPVDFPQAFLFNAIANLNLQKLDAAEKSTADLLDMDKQHRYVKAEHVMAVIKAQKQDWAGAATHFRAYLSNARPGTEGLDLAQKQLAEVEKTLAAQKQN